MDLNKKIVFVADIADDIDDQIAIEYLAVNGYLRCLVLDGKSRDGEREKALVDIGVEIVSEIPDDTEIIFCGGAFTKIADFVENDEHRIKLLVANGGFAGSNIVKPEDELPKFKGRTMNRTYNLNMDVNSSLRMIKSYSIDEIILVSKNVCHNPINTIGNLHNDDFLDKYDLKEHKCLHDLLMAKEGINYLLNRPMICGYENIKPIYERNGPDKMTTWGSSLYETSHIKITTKYN